MGFQFIVTGAGPVSEAQEALWFDKQRMLLRQAKQGSDRVHSPDADTADQDAEAPAEDPYIVCRQCRQAITKPEARISVEGAHLHTFANPHGMVFEIGCFDSTEGCGYAGPASDEFTWFAGYRWRVCFCASCLSHLGWLFTSTGGDAFHGLILERLIAPD